MRAAACPRRHRPAERRRQRGLRRHGLLERLLLLRRRDRLRLQRRQQRPRRLVHSPLKHSRQFAIKRTVAWQRRFFFGIGAFSQPAFNGSAMPGNFGEMLTPQKTPDLAKWMLTLT